MPKSTIPNLEISDDERVTIVGKTGSGKTVLAREFLRAIDRLIVIDSKFNIDPVAWGAEVLHDIPKTLPDQFRYIIRLDDPTLAGDLLLRFEDFYLYIDELFAVFPNANAASSGWRGLWTRGRERHIAVWAGVQRPSAIPLVTLSEADHHFVFRLAMAEDRDRMSRIVGVELPKLQGHSFVYANPARDVYWQVDHLELENVLQDQT